MVKQRPLYRYDFFCCKAILIQSKVGYIVVAFIKIRFLLIINEKKHDIECG